MKIETSGHFDVVGGNDRRMVVTEYTECFYRVSVTKHYPPIKGAVTYKLQDGTPLRRSNNGYFATLDGERRYFIVEAEEDVHPC